MKSNLKSKSVSKQGLVISLDEVKNPHPEIHKIYKETGADKEFYPYQDRAEFINEKRIFKIAAASNKHVAPRKIIHKIISIYRKKQQNKEYCYFLEHLQTTDLFGNEIDHSRRCGSYDLPNIVVNHGLNPAAINYGDGEATEPESVSISIKNVETKYEWTFEEIKPQLQKWYDEGIIDDNTNFYVQVNNRKYTIDSWDKFIDFSIEDLVLVNMYHDKLPALGLATSELLQYVKQAAKDEIVKGLKGQSETKTKIK